MFVSRKIVDELDWDGGEVLMGEREKGKKSRRRAGLLYIIIKWKTMVNTKGNARWF